MVDLAAVSSMVAPMAEGDASTVKGFGRAATSSVEASTAEDVAMAMVDLGGGVGRRRGAGPVMISPAAIMVAWGKGRINYECKRAQDFTSTR